MKTITKTVLGGLAGIVLSMQLSGCGSCSNDFNDFKRDLSKRDYEVTLYSADGHVIVKETLKNTFINVGENGSGLRYLKNGKMVMLNGTYILEEK
jgi:hypothetical protein